MLKRTASFLLISLVLVSCAEQQILAPPTMRPRAIVGVAPFPTILEGAVALNDSGWVVGNLPNGVYIQRPGQPVEYLAVGGPALGISNSGHVIGGQVGGEYLWSPFIWVNGVGAYAGLIPHPVDGAMLTSVNSFGHATGSSLPPQTPDLDYLQSNCDEHVILWTGNHAQDLGALGNGGEGYSWSCNPPDGHVGANAVGWSINDSDVIAGSFNTRDVDGVFEHAFRWANGQMQDLGTLGGRNSLAKQVNNAGQITGWASNAEGKFRAYLWEAGTMRDLGTLGGSNSWGWGITSDGKVIGESQLAGDMASHIFLWSATDGMEDLGIGGTLQEWEIGFSGYRRSRSIAVNNRLQLLIDSKLYQLEFTPTNTTPGSNISVTPINTATGTPAPIEMMFDQVVTPGSTSVTASTIGASGSPPPPSGFQLGTPATFYQISTTATFNGSVSLCIDYTGVSFGSEAELRLLHYENGTWVDITSPGYPNTTTNEVCGVTSSFSPFLIAELNQAPVVTSIVLPSAPVPIGSTVAVSATFTDLNPGDGHTGSFSWADASSSAAQIAESGGSGTASSSHAYAAPGVYTLEALIIDGSLAGSRSSASDIPAYVVVYDPAGGFVTGAGWIASPPGSYSGDTGASGKATFGFVSKYAKGKTIPDGNTEFSFNTGQFKFASTSYDWLVVSGAKASYKGTGRINGAGSYRFMLTAIDGDLASGGIDRFRIRIWDDIAGSVVYDNQRGGADDADPSSALGGGSIVVHK